MTRKTALLILAIIVVVILLPAAAVSFGGCPGFPPPAKAEPPPSTKETVEKKSSGTVRLYRTDRKEIVPLDLEQYLVGVILAEMPASFELEALKAQAVIARTYALHQHPFSGGGGCDRAPGGADICSDSAHCQAWLDPEEAAEWGPGGELFLKRIQQAISETAGEVAVYRGKLIEAVNHSTCGGKTEASHALWNGGSLPYLQSVTCPYCTHSPHYRGELLIPFTRLAEALPQDPALPVASAERLPLEKVTETSGGRIAALTIAGRSIGGAELRSLLELPSTAFTWELREEGLLFHTRGRGHGVGLCQYGADGAARKGQGYRQIIQFYYPGTTITEFKP